MFSRITLFLLVLSVAGPALAQTKPKPATPATQTPPALNKALVAATRKGDVEEMDALIRRGAKVNGHTTFRTFPQISDVDPFGYDWAPLFWAIEAKSLPAVRLLISRGANVNARVESQGMERLPDDPLFDNPFGDDIFLDSNISPLDRAVRWNRGDIVQVLLEAGAKSDVVRAHFDSEVKVARAYHIATYFNATEALKVLLDDARGQDLNDSLAASLDWASLRGHLEMVRLLVERGGSEQSRLGALENAVKWRNLDVAAYLAPTVDLHGDSGALFTLLTTEWNTLPVPIVLEHNASTLTPVQREEALRSVREVQQEHEQAVNLIGVLAARGADPNLTLLDHENPKVAVSTMLLTTLSNGEPDFATALIQAGANAKSSPRPLPSPLRFLASNGLWAQLNTGIQESTDGNFSRAEWDKFARELQGKDLAVAQALVEAGADVKSDGNRSALGEAALAGNTALVRFLLEKGANPNAEVLPYNGAGLSNQGQSFGAFHATSVRPVRTKPEFASEAKNQTPLHLAAGGGHLEAVKALLKAGANAKAHDSHGWNALHYLAFTGRTADITGWEQRIASIKNNSRSIGMYQYEIFKPLPKEQMEVLSQWASADDTAIANALIEAGCPVNEGNNKGLTPLQLAMRGSDRGVVDALLKVGAKPAPGALFEIVEHGRRAQRVAGALLKLQLDLADASRAEVDEPGETATNRTRNKQWATAARKQGFADRTRLLSEWGNRDARVVESLIQAGADVNERNATGLTPLMVAARRGQIEVVKVLMNAGADRNARDAKGQNVAEQIERFGTAPSFRPVKVDSINAEDIPIKLRARDEALICQQLGREDAAIRGLFLAEK